MTFEPETVRQRLKLLREYLSQLETIRGIPREDFVADFRHYWVAERGLQLAAEVMLDIANHILASVYHRFPETNEGALDELAACEVISPGLRESLQGFGGLRNVLVHRYLDIDEGQVHEHLQQAPDRLHRFVGEILQWLERRTEA